MTPPRVDTLERVPTALKEGRRAVLWTLENRNGKQTKFPRVPRQPLALASVNAPDTWGTFEEAVTAVLDGKCDGIGRVLGDGLAVLDLDHCRDPETGAIAPQANVIVRALNSYTEISPSRTGLHVWCKGAMPEGGRRKGPIELYDSRRYMTITGEHLEGTPLNVEERTAELRALHASVFALHGSDPHLEDNVLILCACNSDHGHFRELWSGQLHRHGGDHSRADLALCAELAIWTKKDAAWMDRLFRQSALMRPKWDEARGTHTYGQRTIGKALSRSANVGSSCGLATTFRSDPHSFHPVLVTLADVQPEAVQWLWPGRIAAGKLTMICGDPGLGKSWITLDIAARVSSGSKWPDAIDGTSPSNVLLLSAEDGLADTIRPRLESLGADLHRIRALSMVRRGNSERGVQLSDISAIGAAIAETDARLLIIDPISAYLADTDAHRDAEVRSRIAPLAALAESTGAAVIVVMHLSKSTQRPAIYRAGGSIAFAAAARIVLAVAADPDDNGRRVFAPVKCNLSAPPLALTYTLSDGRLTWGSQPLRNVDIDRLLSGTATTDRTTRNEADPWLLEALKDGPVDSSRLIEEARAAGFSRRTIFRAKARLGINATRIGFGGNGGWSWHLPSPNDAAQINSERNVALIDTRDAIQPDFRL